MKTAHSGGYRLWIRRKKGFKINDQRGTENGVMDFIQHWEWLLSGSVMWGGMAYLFKEQSSMIREMRESMAMLKEEAENRRERLVEMLEQRVSHEECERVISQNVSSRNEFRSDIMSKFTGLLSNITTTDLKWHEQSCKAEACWTEILQRLSAVEAILKERQSRGQSRRTDA
jgi:glutamate synthase domain-containing protein 3